MVLPSTRLKPYRIMPKCERHDVGVSKTGEDLVIVCFSGSFSENVTLNQEGLRLFLAHPFPGKKWILFKNVNKEESLHPLVQWLEKWQDRLVWRSGENGTRFLIVDKEGTPIDQPEPDVFKELDDGWRYGATWKELAKNAGWSAAARRLTSPGIDDMRTNQDLFGWEIVIRPGEPMYKARQIAT